MTNVEAIERLEWVKKRISEITYSPESFEAINMAIEALRREALVDKMTKAYYKELRGEADNEKKRIL